jgi:hypothetical protein
MVLRHDDVDVPHAHDCIQGVVINLDRGVIFRTIRIVRPRIYMLAVEGRSTGRLLDHRR